MGFLPKEILEQLVKDGVKEGASLNVYDCSIKKIYNEVINKDQEPELSIKPYKLYLLSAGYYSNKVI